MWERKNGKGRGGGVRAREGREGEKRIERGMYRREEGGGVKGERENEADRGVRERKRNKKR